MEHPHTQAPDNTTSAIESQIDDEGEAAHLRMMQAVFAAANAEGDENV